MKKVTWEYLNRVISNKVMIEIASNEDGPKRKSLYFLPSDLEYHIKTNVAQNKIFTNPIDAIEYYNSIDIE